MQRNQTTVIRWLHRSAMGCIFLTLFAPLLFSSEFMFPFITTKTFYFRLLVEIALLLYLILLLYDTSFLPRMSPLSWAIIAYLGILVAASLFGVNPYRSFWGNIERGEGLLTILHVFAWWFLVIALFQKKRLLGSLLWVAFSVSILEALYGLLQIINVQWVIFGGAGRVGGTIGNPAFLAAFLLLGMVIGGVLYAQTNKKPVKAFLVAAVLFQLFIIYRTQTRGVLLSLFGVFEVVALGYAGLSLFRLFRRKGEGEGGSRRAASRAVAAVLIAFAVPAFLFVAWKNKESSWVQSSGALRRIVNISMDDITTQSRLYAWDSSWKGWKDRFLLGYGYENYQIAFNKYFHPEIFIDQGSQLWFDRAHNILFDQAVTAGILGLLSYLALFGSAFWILIRVMRSAREEGNRSLLRAGGVVLAGFFVYIGQNLFVFDTLSSYLFLYLLFAWSAQQYVWRFSEEGGRQARSFAVPASTRALFAAVLAVVVFFGAYMFNIRPARANMKAIDALVYSRRAEIPKQGEEPALVARTFYGKAFDTFRDALAVGSYQAPEIRQKMAEIVLQALRNSYLPADTKKEIADFAIEEIKKNIISSPLDAQNYMYLMTLYNASERYDRSRLDKVIEIGKKVLELSPTRPQIYFDMGQAAISKGSYEEGIQYFKKAVELNPRPVESRWNLAAAYILAGNLEEAERVFQQMRDDGFDFYRWENVERLARVYAQVNQYEQLIKLYTGAIERSPDREEQARKRIAEVYVQIAASNEKSGDRNAMIEALQKAAEYDPSLKPQIEEFLKSNSS